MGDYHEFLKNERQKAGIELSENVKELRRLIKPVKTALNAIDAVLSRENETKYD